MAAIGQHPPTLSSSGCLPSLRTAPTRHCRGPARSRAPQANSAATAAPLEQSAQPISAVAASSPAFSRTLAANRAVLQLACDALQLQPVHSSAAPDGAFTASSHDGSSAATVLAFRGGPVRWLSSAALANQAAQGGTCRLMGFVEGDRDVPHFSLEHVLAGERIQGAITLFPRQNWVTDLDYLHAYFSSAPREGLRDYNSIMNDVAATSARLPGWRHYASPVAEVKPLLASSIAYSFPAEQDSLEAFREAALEVARLWLAFLAAPPSAPRSAKDLNALDARYFSSVTSDPDNIVAVRLFGEEATNRLLKMATGHPSVAG